MLVLALPAPYASGQMKQRARHLGIVIGPMEPGPANAITDVSGVRVGHTTLVEGDSIRTGVTVVVPHEGPEPTPYSPAVIASTATAT